MGKSSAADIEREIAQLRARVSELEQERRRRMRAEQVLRANEERLFRQNQALSRLAARQRRRSDDAETSVRHILETAAVTLRVARASVWLYDDDRSEIRCLDLFDQETGAHSSGLRLARADCAAYFEALDQDLPIAADDARTDPRTRDFAPSYLVPLGITAMLDAPIRKLDHTMGVLCHEHVGPPRGWTFDEQNFATSVANMVSLALEIDERRRIEASLRRSVERERLVTVITTRFIDEDAAATIRLSLQSIGHFSRTDRVYVFRYDQDAPRLEEHFEWRAEGIPALFERVRDQPIERFRWYHERMLRGEPIRIPSVADLPPDSAARGPLEEMGVRALIAVPIHYRDTVLGSIGLQMVRADRSWDDDEVAMLDLLGEIVGMVLTRRDAEQALKESETKYRSLYEATGQAVMLQDDDGFIDCNAAAIRMFGCRNVEEFIGKHPAVFSAKVQAEGADAYALAERHMAKTLEEGSHRFEWGSRRLDGTQFPSEVLLTTIRLGDRLLLQAIVQDITERKQAERALRETTERLQGILRYTTAVIYIKDTAGRYVLVNRRWVDLFHVAADQVVGKTDHQLWPKEVADALVANDRAVLQANRPVEIEEHVPHEDGTHIYISNKFPITDADGAPTALCGISTDITDRKRAERESQRDKELAEAASGAKSEFLANMSHEIRTPMNAIIGMTDLALTTAPSDEQREYLRIVKISANALLALVDDILDFSKIEAGRLELEEVEFDLGQVVADTIKSLALQAHDKGLELTGHIHSDVPHSLVGDPGRLRQVLVNLVGNAIKFTLHGSVEMTVESEAVDGDQVRLRFLVADTGIGIEQETQRIIFDAFTQQDSSMTRRFGGTGLGLAISARLVELLGGRVGVESRVGIGSEFRFTARFGLADRKSDPAMEKLSDGLAGVPILVADASPTNQRHLADTLRAWKMAPTLCRDDATAFHQLERARAAGRPFPVALVDLESTDDLASEASMRILRAGLAGAVVPMLPTRHSTESLERLREFGFAAVLVKPITACDLFDALTVALRLDDREDSKGASALSSRPSRPEPLRILVAEDNAFNRTLLATLLGRQGHEIELADNGRAALDQVRVRRIDLVLLDVQMPEMDGFAVSCAIRAREKETGGPRLPIIAITAHAMKGDRERCLDAGMDGYVAKPISAERLFREIDRVMESHGRLGPYASAAPELPDAATDRVPRDAEDSVLDFERLLENVGGSRDRLRLIGATFLEELPKLVDDVEQAVEARDGAALSAAAHTLKGAIGVVSRKDAYEAVLRLEEVAQETDLAGIDDAHAMFQSRIGLLSAAVERLCDGADGR